MTRSAKPTNVQPGPTVALAANIIIRKDHPAMDTTTTNELITLGPFTATRQELDQLTTIVAGNSEAPADAIIWRDVFCFECDGNCPTGQVTIQGTARQLAEQAITSGFSILYLRPDTSDTICLTCADL